MAEPNDDDRLDADRFLGRYGEGPPLTWERADLVVFIAELRERYQGAPDPHVYFGCDGRLRMPGAPPKHTCGHVGRSDNGPWYHCHVCQSKGCKACEVDALARAKSRHECCPTCYALVPSFVITPDGKRCADPWHAPQRAPQKPEGA